MTDTFSYPALEQGLSLHPEDVAHHRELLHRWWSQPGKWQREWALQGRRKHPDWVARDNEAEEARWWMAETIKAAELYWVSPEMCDVLVAMAPSIPDCTPQPPVPDALVMFAKSIPGTDAESGAEIFTSAILWGNMNLFGYGQCIAAETYAWREQVKWYAELPPKRQEQYRQIYPNRLQPTGGSEWPLGAMTTEFNTVSAETETMKTSMIEDRRILSTFWALASQRIVVETRERPYTRQQLRHAQRQGHELPEIRVINLREPTGHGSTDANAYGTREYSHRWIVGAHWRNQWYASEQTHRPKLIEAYVKGPEDKPLKVRETVRALVR